MEKEKNKSPEKITIVEFTAFNTFGTMILEDIDAEKIEATIKRKTSETAIIHSYTEYSGIENKTHIVVQEDTKNVSKMQVPHGFYESQMKKMVEDAEKKKKLTAPGDEDIVNTQF